MIPYEAGNSRKSNMGHLSVFGCIVYTIITKPHLKKLDDLSTKMVFVGYEMGSMAYRGNNLCTGHVHITRDVMFEVELLPTNEYARVQDTNDVEPTQGVAPWTQPGARTPSLLPTPPPIEYRTLPSVKPDINTSPEEDGPLRFLMINNVLGRAEVIRLEDHAFQEERYVVIAEEPTSLAEAPGDPS
jgi:hypothetical protein